MNFQVDPDVWQMFWCNKKVLLAFHSFSFLLTKVYELYVTINFFTLLSKFTFCHVSKYFCVAHFPPILLCTLPNPRSLLARHGSSPWSNRFAIAYHIRHGGWQINYLWAQHIVVKVAEVYDIGNMLNKQGNCVGNTLTLCTVLVTSSNNIGSR